MDRVCKVCNNEKPVRLFRFHSTTGYYARTCVDCENLHRRQLYKHGIESKGDILNTTHTKIKSKVCNRCRMEKLLNKENYPYQGGHYLNICKICISNNKIVINREKIKEDYGKLKSCGKCNQSKEITENFYFSKTKKKYSSHCIFCHSLVIDKRTERNTITDKVNRLYKSYRDFDFKRQIEFNLSKEFIKDSIIKSCTYCGFSSTGLDRLDNSKGHTEENCVSCCSECNTARMDNFSHEEMIIMGKCIREIKLTRIKQPEP